MLEKYNRARNCQKCGGQAIVHYKERHDKFSEIIEDIMVRTCATCFYTWSELPLDHKESEK